MSRRRRLWTAIAVVAVVGVTFGLYWFQPWKLFLDHRVDEKLPDVAVGTQVVDVQPTESVPSSSSPSAAKPTATLLSRGKLISHEHGTSGTVSVIRQADGSRVLTLADLDTSDGPQVQVWLTDAPVLRGEKGWHVFDDGKHVNLGGLKGNLGNQVYKIPADANLDELTSVSLWCARFDVSFGAAKLRPTN